MTNETGSTSGGVVSTTGSTNVTGSTSETGSTNAAVVYTAAGQGGWAPRFHREIEDAVAGRCR